MQTRYFLTILLSLSAYTAQANSTAEPAYELTCRNKAKEIAAETYRGCITENKTAAIEQIRKEYQEKLKNLKDQYDNEIKKLGVKKVEASKNRPKLPNKRLAKKTQPSQSINFEDEAVEVKDLSPSNKVSTPIDESSMDLPEPIPLEQ